MWLERRHGSSEDWLVTPQMAPRPFGTPNQAPNLGILSAVSSLMGRTRHRLLRSSAAPDFFLLKRRNSILGSVKDLEDRGQPGDLKQIAQTSI